MEIFLARTQGFCAGVSYAIDIVEQALAKYGTPLYVYHEIVHNRSIVEDFKRRGVIFVEDITQVPEGAHAIFSAHGVPPTVIHMAQQRQLHYVNATCPLVTKVHKEAMKFSQLGIDVILIGHRGHQELIGTSGYVHPELLHVVEDSHDIQQLPIATDKPVAVLTQTTLSVDDTKILIDQLKTKFSKLITPAREDICYATQNRQDAVKELAEFCDIIIIVGSPNSSNSNRLRETGAARGVPSYIIDTDEELDYTILKNKKRLGISSGASVPEFLVNRLVERIQQHYPGSTVKTFENPEKNIVFKLPVV